MEFLNSTVSTSCRISPNIPFLSHNFPFTTWKNTKYPLGVTSPNTRRLILCSKKFQVSAHFGRPTSRRNYLRKKLTEGNQKVIDLQNPIRKLNESDVSESNVDSYDKEKSDLGDKIGESGSVIESKTETTRKVLGESVLWNKFENWVEQYNKDTEMWGIGTGPIFTVFQDSEGQIRRVDVNKDEILVRSQVIPLMSKESDSDEVSFKLSYAKELAREMEKGREVIPLNSSVVKLVKSGGQSRLMDTIQVVKVKPGLFFKMSKVGLILLCGAFVVWAVKELLTFGDDSEEYSTVEKEMLNRKLKARKKKEKMVTGSVEIMQDSTEPISVPLKRPELDKEELAKSIVEAKGLSNESALMEYSGYKPDSLNDKVEEIRAMARHARELEQKGSSEDNGGASSLNDLRKRKAMYIRDFDGTTLAKSSDDLKHDVGLPTEEASPEEIETQTQNVSNADGVNLKSDKRSVRTKLRVIKSVKEAREYLSRKTEKAEVNQEPQAVIEEQVDTVSVIPSTVEASDYNVELSDSSLSNGRQKISNTNEDFCSEIEEHASVNNGNSDAAERKVDGPKNLYNEDPRMFEEASIPPKKHQFEGTDDKVAGIDLEMPVTKEVNGGSANLVSSENKEIDGGSANLVSSEDKEMPVTKEVNGGSANLASSENKENWTEKYFHEFEPLVQKIAVGFGDNYQVARENIDQDVELKFLKHDDELEWMKDERLRDVVFRVRENELSGRDPFYLMDEEDKRAFFGGLEKKVEQANEKLLNLHSYFHSNIENLDYGADGISLYDSPEKIIPRWKGPPAEVNPEFLNNFVEQRKAVESESIKNSPLKKNSKQDSFRKSEPPSPHRNKPSVSPKTIIEGSDGSVRPGKKSGKEYWEHTKKWSKGFLEVYNAETDPEVKAAMKDMGKDLDRWATEEEIQEAVDEATNKIPKSRKSFEEKLNKLKREMELFGPQAVVSKYREYGEEKEEDYLWWLDLPYVLCIELYTVENEEQRVGFYSLEMATDLELEPKPYHVIGFEDAGDSKNLCHIIQAQMDILGTGSAFVVALPPKDVYREAKANGFSVTVIRKGELQLNVDLTLEEVEELIAEIGSKIYHDKIMRERSVDIKALKKGLGISQPAMRRISKRKLKMRTKP